MENDQRRDNYETQKGITYLDEDTRQAKLTPRQRKRLRHKENSRKTHSHQPDVRCITCSQPGASASV